MLDIVRPERFEKGASMKTNPSPLHGQATGPRPQRAKPKQHSWQNWDVQETSTSAEITRKYAEQTKSLMFPNIPNINAT